MTHVQAHSISPRPTSQSWGLVVIAVALLAVGLVAVASASSSYDRPMLGQAIWRMPFGRQAVFALIGFGLMLSTEKLGARLLDSSWACKWLPLAGIVMTVAALAVTLIADPHRGSQRWLRVAPGSAFELSFQPSEIAKITLLAFLAAWLGGRDAAPRSFWRGLFVPALVLGATVLLVGSEDFGTASLLTGVGGLLLFVAGCRLRYLFPLMIVGVAVLVVLLLIEPYRLERLKAHDTLWSDPRGAGYQPLQSLTTIASGGWLGLGLGEGVQKHGYLPESHTDFVFSIVCEETGMVGGGLVLALFCGLICLGWQTFRAAPTMFERLLAFGLTAMIGCQAAMNIAVVTAVTPTKGISLPFVSAGGSGTLTFCIAIGLLAAIATRRAGSERRTFSAPVWEVPE